MGKINFTKATIDSLPLPEPGKRAMHNDTKQAGLVLRVTSSGVKTFYAYKRVKGGSPEMISIGRYPEITIEVARKKAAEIVLELAQGNSVAQSKKEFREEPTLDQLFDSFLERHAKLKKKSWKTDETYYRLYLGKSLGKKKLSRIERRAIVALMDQMVEGGKSEATAERAVLALGRKMYAWAKEKSIWEGNNPFIGITGAKKNERDRFLQEGELPKFFKAVMREDNDVIRDFVLLSLFTGQRRGNVRAMKWQDIDLERKVWRISGDEFKNGKHQAFALTEAAFNILRERKTHAEPGALYVFPARAGNSGHLTEPKKGWRRILDRAEVIGLAELIEEAKKQEGLAEILYKEAIWGRSMPEAITFLQKIALELDLDTSGLKIENLRLHDLRHTFASWQANNGSDLFVIGKSLGHRSINSAARYAHLLLDPVRASTEGATQLMLQAAGLKKEDVTIDE